MHNMPELVPVSDLRYKHKEVLEKLPNGPILLAQRSRPAAVLVSVSEWDAIANELRRYRALEVAAQRAMEMQEDPSKRIPFTKEELLKRGVLDD